MKKSAITIIGIILAVIVVIIIIAAISSGGDSGQSTASGNESAVKDREVGIGEVLETSYFEITVNSAYFTESVDTGNMFTDLEREEGNKYLVMSVSYKNIDDKPRTIFDGTLYINYNGKEYKYDSSESILLEGWGVFLEEVNPLTTFKTNLVYKVASEMTGDVYWESSSSFEKIYLGKL